MKFLKNPWTVLGTGGVVAAVLFFLRSTLWVWVAIATLGLTTFAWFKR